MKIFRFIVLAGLLMMGCERNQTLNKTTCGSDDPLHDYAFLQDLKNSFTNCSCEMSIIQATYKDQTVFFAAMTDALCNGIQGYALLNCDGEVVKTYTSENMQDYAEEVTNRKVIYSCKD